jgi:lipopolysaccharide biosynthesis protein
MRHRASRLTQAIYARLSYGMSYLRRAHQCLDVWKPDHAEELGEHVALFVHYDSAGEVRPHTLHYIRCLKDAGFNVVVVSNAGDLQAASWVALRQLCHGVIVRRNVGYDFGAMKEGLKLFGLPTAKTQVLLLVNDSVYGPLKPLAAMLARMNFDEADVWGATDSWQHCYHLQSYFVAFGQRALLDPAWTGFWQTVRMVQSKSYVVSRYEVGLTQAMLKAGLRCAALFPYADIVDVVRKRSPPDIFDDRDATDHDPVSEARLKMAKSILHSASGRVALNPTAELWRPLLQSGYPFIKRELLQKNPSNVEDLSDWRDVVRSHTDADIHLIERDLKRTMKHYAA